jgi:hypothetical protein
MLMHWTDGGPPDICYSFHARLAAESYEDRDEDMLDLITREVKFKIVDGFYKSGGAGYGILGTTMAFRKQRGAHAVHCGARIQIAWQNMIPLLRKSTTPSERIVQQFQVVETVSSKRGHLCAPALY